MGCCLPTGINFATPNQVTLVNSSNDLVVFSFSVSDVCLSPGQSTTVTVLLKDENFVIQDKNKTILGGMPVHADLTMTCRPDFINVTQLNPLVVVTERPELPPAAGPNTHLLQEQKRENSNQINYSTPNQVELHNASNSLVVMKYSVGTVVLSPGQTTHVTILLKQENFVVMDQDKNILGGVSVQADMRMRCTPDYICFTADKQIVNRRP